MILLFILQATCDFFCRFTYEIFYDLYTYLHETGAHNRTWTGDLILTKDVLYRLSYVGI